jgi:hypothetical protein
MDKQAEKQCFLNPLRAPNRSARFSSLPEKHMPTSNATASGVASTWQ